ncbi:DUF6204 family protein [Kitasatospora sp. NPDC101155]|uniref:DUF6204 family protein n=1 Tax=Kitasatospora sp. NPDC101155 TaxID=3364097 RepID=UPI0038173D88
MSGTTYQVITHGNFAELTDEQRASLVAQAGEHDLFKARFTEEGTVTYEPALLTFTFRVLIPATADDTEDLVLGRAEIPAQAGRTRATPYGSHRFAQLIRDASERMRSLS